MRRKPGVPVGGIEIGRKGREVGAGAEAEVGVEVELGVEVGARTGEERDLHPGGGMMVGAVGGAL